VEPGDVGQDRARTGSVVAIGNFDGVHKGHQLLISRAVSDARARGLRSVVLTFDRHPATVVRPGRAPKLLTGVEHKLELLRSTGVDEVAVLRFDERRAAEGAEDFVRDVLVGRLDARTVVVGTNFRFGHHQHGDVALLESMGRVLGFDVDCVDLVTDEVGESASIVSSSLVRSLVSTGELQLAEVLLGRPFEVRAPLGELRAADSSTVFHLLVPPGLLVPPPGDYEGVAVRAAEGAEGLVPVRLSVDGGDLVEISVLLAGAEVPVWLAALRPGDVLAVRFGSAPTGRSAPAAST